MCIPHYPVILILLGMTPKIFNLKFNLKTLSHTPALTLDAYGFLFFIQSNAFNICISIDENIKSS